MLTAQNECLPYNDQMLAAFYEPFFDESADALFKMTKDYPGGTPQQIEIYAWKQQCLIGNVSTAATSYDNHSEFTFED